MIGNSQIIELFGLPGSGKTTAAKSLLELLGSEHISLARKYSRWLHGIHMDRLFLPLTAVKFQEIFKELYLYDTNHSEVSFPQWMLKLIWQMATRSKRRQLDHASAPISIFLLLNQMVVEYFFVAIEVWFFRRFVVIDEGFVQRGLGVWMRAPEKIRQSIWNRYFSCVPNGVQSILFTTSTPDHPLLRAKQRPRGARAVLLWLPTPRKNELDLAKQYEDMHKLLENPIVFNRIRCFNVNAEANQKEVVDELFRRIEELNPEGNIVIFTRD